MRPKLTINDGKLLSLVEDHLMSYYIIEDVDKSHSPSLHWHCNPIPWKQWNDIKNICAYTYKEHKSECMIRLYYNENEDVWKTAFFKQTMQGMTVSDDFDIEILKEEGCTIEDGFVEAGSVHHHCSSGAFQSGTDEKDEAQTPGLHITLGKIDKDVWELHSRFKTMHGFSGVNIPTFFKSPNWLEEIPEKYADELRYKVMSELICSAGKPEDARKDWIGRIIEKKEVQSTFNYSPYGYNRNYPRPYEWDDTKRKPSKDKKEIKKFYEQTAFDMLYEYVDTFLETHQLNPLLMEETELNDIINEKLQFMKSLITSPKDKMLSEYDKTEWDLIRETIKEEKEVLDVSLTHLLGWINKHETELFATVQNEILANVGIHPLYDEKENNTTDTETTTNNQISHPILH